MTHATYVQDPDLLDHVLRICLEMAPGFTEEVARQIGERTRLELGGQRVTLAKRGKRLTEEKRAAVYQDITSSLPTEEIIRRHEISRASIYRLAKRGPG